MSDECVIVENVDKNQTSSPPLKKLKQSRLPFAPINIKSPKQNEIPNEKKRKHSGSEEAPNISKTPRSESREVATPDENKEVIDISDSSAGKNEASSDQPSKDGNKKGKGAKAKLKGGNASSPLADGPTAIKKKGRPSGAKQSSSNLNKSVDLESAKGEKEKPVEESSSQKSNSEKETSTIKDSDENLPSNKETPKESESSNDQDVKKDESDSKSEDKNSSITANESGVKKRGRPKKSLTPTKDADAPQRKRGRPAGSKNIKRDGSTSSLNRSICSDDESKSLGCSPLASKKEQPLEKTRKLLSLFTSSGSSLSKQTKKETNKAAADKSSSETDDVIVDMSKCEESNGTETGKNGLEKSGEVMKDENVENNDDLKVDSAKKNEVKESEIKEKDKPDSIKQNKETASEKNEKNIEKIDPSSEISGKVKKDQEKSDESSETDLEKNEGKKETTEDSDLESSGNSDDQEKQNENDKKDDQEEQENNKDAKENKSTDLDKSNSELEGNVSKTSSPNRSINADNSPSSNVKTPTAAGKKNILAHSKKLTPKQKEKEEAKRLKMEEREKQKQERERQLQMKLEEKEKLRKEKEEEKEKLRKEKEEEKRLKEEERLKQKEEKDKAKEELRKKKQEELDVKKQKREEELQKKEEERRKKEEEQLKKEEEKRKQSDKLKNKFASFFVAKKREETEEESKDTDGPFQEFRVKEDMLLAPLVRKTLSESQVSELDECIGGKQLDTSKTYLHNLKSEKYVKGKSLKTWPNKFKSKEKEDEDDVMIIDEDDNDEEMLDCSAMIQDEATNIVKGKRHKAKLLLFCENRRPAYWGTWSKKCAVVSSRRPFAKEEIFDYEYDSDDDWEEEEAGESLSDSEGEDKEEKEDEGGDNYEVDNDFFVPHGYLSDDEGKSDQEEDEEDEKQQKKEGEQFKDTDKSKSTEQLKLKQAEFEEEMKKKTKQLKPRLIGCLWMADQNNNPAYDQLMKILGPHRAVTLCTQLPIGSRHLQGLSKEAKENDGDDEGADYRIGNSKKFVKTFPEDAIPALIKMLHGNRHGKSKLCPEFGNYWRKLTGGELSDDMINHTPVKTQAVESVLISKRKTEAKIQELGTWKRCLDEKSNRHIMCWYVPKKIREEYGLGDLELQNSWIYINNLVKEKKEVEAESEEDTPKANKIRPITAFTKKIPSTPSSANTSPTSTPTTTPLHNKSTNASLTESSGKIPSTPVDGVSLHNTPSSASTSAGKQSSTGKKGKKKINLFPAKTPESPGPPQKGSIASFFKKNKTDSSQTTKTEPDTSKNSPKETLKESSNDTEKESTEGTSKEASSTDDVITLD